MTKVPNLRYLVLLLVMVGLVVPNVAQQALVGCQPTTTTSYYFDAESGNNVPIEVLNEDTQCSMVDLLEVPIGIFNMLIGLAAAVLMLLIIIAGFKMMLYHTADAPEAELQNAKMTLRYALTGFAIVMLTFLIVRTFVVVILKVDAGSDVGILLNRFFKGFF